MNFFKSILVIAVICTLASCTSLNRSMREPNSRLNLNKSDFTMSEQVSGTATSTKILMVDWSRLFNTKTGSIDGSFSLASIPVFGTILGDETANLALYELMNANPGFDVVLYPQYVTTVLRPIGLGFIFKTTTVKATARLGKLK